MIDSYKFLEMDAEQQHPGPAANTIKPTRLSNFTHYDSDKGVAP